ncbi:MAG: alanine racemase [Acidimicrobiales bacterium]
MSRSWVDVDLGAVAANVATLRAAAPDAELCAVVKAEGYGHGAVAVAQAALDAGATRLAVAQVGEGMALRAAGLEAPIWILSEPDPPELGAAARHRLEPAVYSTAAIDTAAAAATAGEPLTVHLKIDTGMHRAGAAPGDAIDLAGRIVAAPSLILGSVWTHLACADDDAADDPDAPTGRQLACYEATLAALAAAGVEVPLRHAANSAGCLLHPRSRHDVVRCGLALYGLAPTPELAAAGRLRPALTWRSTVGMVKRLPAGSAVSYGWRQRLAVAATVATVPVGYADGYRRALWERGAVLIGGRRRPIVGVVTMDQLVADCGDDPVRPGDEVVLLGRQGDESITADELAGLLGTINYEIPTAIGPRVERRHRLP